MLKYDKKNWSLLFELWVVLVLPLLFMYQYIYAIVLLFITIITVENTYSQNYSAFRYQLRVRYFPKDLKELYTRDKVTFFYLYDQVGQKKNWEREEGITTVI